MADKIAIILEARQSVLQPLMVLPSNSFTSSVTDVSKSDLPASTQDQPTAFVLPAVPAVESEAMPVPTQAEIGAVDCSSALQQEMKDKSEMEVGAACDIVAEASGAQELPNTVQTTATSSTSRKSSSASKLNRVSTARSHIPKLTPLKTSRESSPTKASSLASTAQPTVKTPSRPAVVTSRSRTTGEISKSSRKTGESPVKIVRQLSASTISSGSSSSTSKTSTLTKPTPTTPKVSPRSFKMTENSSKRSTANIRNLSESKKTAVAGNLLHLKMAFIFSHMSSF